MRPVEKITSEKFAPYGCLIEHPHKDACTAEDNLFHVVLRETCSQGWRIAFLVVRDKSIDKLEQHPRSFESFEPVSGRSLLFVSQSKDPGEVRCFLLDRPVVLNKGVWHGVVTLDYESEIKITENADVECVYWPLETRLYLESETPGAIADHF